MLGLGKIKSFVDPVYPCVDPIQSARKGRPLLLKDAKPRFDFTVVFVEQDHLLGHAAQMDENDIFWFGHKFLPFGDIMPDLGKKVIGRCGGSQKPEEGKFKGRRPPPAPRLAKSSSLRLKA
jgi:hypothetical protein